ncbi:hypothetical protein [Glaciihabitans sp. dw_435]|uniref:hypothetical protein n=1 Tax=Glaciihabitans sp. dw_435 TaxID=2720081 RepID=UPI001BD635A8|nr:hypothetical protein [Glaciihabitans sp. dw_435]
MSTITRTWLAFAAIGIGMIHLALVISSPLPIAVVLVILGAIEFAWGIMTFIRDRIAYPKLVLFGALLPILLWSLLMVVAGLLEQPGLASTLGFTALGIASLLELFVAVVIAFQLRRKTDFSVPSRTPAAGRYLLGLFVGGLIVAAATTPALAATEAGAYAQPHGEHTLGFTPKQTSEFNFTVPTHQH